MSILRYGFFGEDDAQRLFLHHYLVAVTANSPWRFEYDADFARRYKAVNKHQVDAQFDEVCAIGLSQYRQHCFFIGRDLDDYDVTAFQQKQAEMQRRLREHDAQAMLSIPVQCIEHWLWYLKRRLDHPKSTKNESFETQPRPEAKLAVYNTKKCSTKHSNPIVEHLAAGMDIEWLASRSTSFQAFHTQVSAYLNGLFPVA
ncbi:hypothetical protein IC235_20510 [Hymenobacter sp. BT664]|uniref:Uncharacterized protein n=1 Tax=Hymenobacter montanus TaxID=2771359 RepID=A0A927GLK2_9BACT|nr:hypothetical protein [Hymenobacter montanus]MBD2770276.1 hypothetical protein [Hymenobacter montanus]